MLKKSLVLVMSLTLMIAGGCSDDDDNDSPVAPSGSTGTLSMLLTDAPGDYEAVNVTFSEVSVHYGDASEDSSENDGEAAAEKTAGEWIVLSAESQTHDLLTLTNGVTALLGEQELEAGLYTQIRLAIESAEVVDADGAHALTVPSGSLKFVSGFLVETGKTTEIIVDFDAARSIHKTGGNSGKYMLKPTIRIINGAQAGSIHGSVSNPEHAPVAYAIAGADTVTSSVANSETGGFVLSFLDEGSYMVSVTDTLGQAYSQDGIAVDIGKKTSLGEITLQ